MNTKMQLLIAGMLLATIGTGLGQQPNITTQPQSCINAVGSTATFTVEATGTEPLAYQWQKYGAEFTDIADCTNAAMVLTNVQTSHAGDYRVVVTNVEGAVTSAVAQLMVILPPRITLQPTNWLVVSLGASVTNRVIAAGALPLSFQWRLNGAPALGQVQTSVAQSTLILTNVQSSDAGDYTAVVTNLAGSVTSRVVTLTVDPTFIKITSGPVVTDVAGWNSPTWWDYDIDGFLDLYIAYNTADMRDGMYHNNGDGTFTRLTNAITKPLGGAMVGALGDYNNDGSEDLYVPVINGTPNVLYWNKGAGSFTQLTGSQVGPPVTDVNNSVDAAWADYDGDGILDLFTANSWYGPVNDCLYHNKGDGTFARMTATQVGGLVTDNATTGPCVWVDYDNDGWPDLWVGSAMREWPITGRQYLWHNNRNGKFSLASAGSLTNNLARGVGVWADYDNDGYSDLFLTSWDATNSLHHNLDGQTFTDITQEAGVGKAMNAWQAAWADYDNDGYLDLMAIAYAAATQSVLYHNNGNGTFTSVDVGSPLSEGARRCGVGWADYDNDGFLDLLITCGDGAPGKNLLYHNSGNSNAWLKVKLVGKASNRSAIGAKVRVQATIRGQKFWQMREINGNSYSGASVGLLAHFGLGDATNVDLVRIEWPSGIVQELSNVPSRQSLTITEHQEEATTPPSLTASKSGDGKVQLSVTGQTNLLYVFEASTDLVQWTKIAVRTNLTGTVEFTPPTSSAPRQFYRVLMP